MATLGSASKPVQCLGGISTNALTFEIYDAEIVLGTRIVLCGGEAPPAPRFGEVLLEAEPVRIHESQARLRASIALCREPAVPIRGRLIILFNAVAAEVIGFGERAR